MISALAARRRPGQVLVGFAAEHGEGALAYGREKLERKRLDAIVVNDVLAGGDRLRRHRNEVTSSPAAASSASWRGGKERIADGVLERYEELLPGGETIEPSSRPRSRRRSLRRSPPTAQALEANISRAVQVRPETLNHLLVALLAEGHALIEDYPGRRQDGAGARAGALDRLPVRARAVHLRSAARRRRRHQRL